MRQLLDTPQTEVARPLEGILPKPLMRGWLHALAAVGAVVLTLLLCWRSWGDGPRLLSLLVFGLTMVELYTVSAVYHIGRWSEPLRRRLRALDHANIFLLIAGTYTPLCFNVLSGWLRPTILATIWVLAAFGVGLATLTLHAPRWVGAVLYVAMGWVSALAIPAFAQALGGPAVLTLLLGGVLYTIGAVIYALKWPNPFPRIFGFHEVFHLFVIGGSLAFAAAIWIWAVPLL
ncbi:MAG TPA: hemolysin III family protein [Ktedonobacterales bacterium]|nr:hemolysin III family protein [Ktedonobacterales bacterium]